MKKHILIVAGGRGTRMNSTTPKQFINLAGKPILMHTIEKFATTLSPIEIILVLAKEFTEEWNLLCKKHNFIIPHQLVDGGETRYQSVKNGLTLVNDAAVVGIHDAVRPLVNKQTITIAFETAELRGNAIPTIPLNDSIRFAKKSENCAVDRAGYHLVQTPQCFHSNLIKQAYLKPYKPLFTDDATVLEDFGEKINLVPGNIENIKITTPFDLVVAEAILSTLK